MRENQRKFKRAVFIKTLNRYFTKVGIDPQTIDMAEFDLDSYDSVHDLLVDVAKNRNHPYSHACSTILNMLNHGEAYGIRDPEVYQTDFSEKSDVEEKVDELTSTLTDEIARLELRIDELSRALSAAPTPHNGQEDGKTLETLKLLQQEFLKHEEALKEMRAAIERNSDFITTLWSRAVNNSSAQSPKAPKPKPGGPRAREPAQEDGGRSKGSIRLMLGFAVSSLLSYMIMPILADQFSWGLWETAFYTMLFVFANLGLMMLEGLWAATAFSSKNKRAEGFAAGYVYSTYMNPYHKGH